MSGDPETLRATLRDLLALPEVRPEPVAEVHGAVVTDTGSRIELRLDGKPATLWLPEGEGPVPAVLYCHAHGGQFDLGRREVAEGARWLASPYGPDLLAAGYAVLAMDMPGFGDRRSEGSESALAKAGFWRGQPLFGQMVGDQLAAFDWLAGHDRIDSTRIAVLGMSMGAALAMWVGALESRVAAVAQLCMLASIEGLIETGVHDRHGLYLIVPGLLRHTDMGQVAGLIAPRPQFVAHGRDDPFTAIPTGAQATLDLRLAYDATGQTDQLVTWIDQETGHKETPAIHHAVLQFLDRALTKRTPC
ncbi:alpha/beta hydrolase family protein [Mameliella alba]|uniref:Esterase n=1 Tax=Mameliella alba TaxID=561184 RepID=A0A0B3S877_9RHOB|nr:alpha/beta fold hydrolase [Mameliella alba]KHQ52881.1 esterase [Mameliella alba]